VSGRLGLKSIDPPRLADRTSTPLGRFPSFLWASPRGFLSRRSARRHGVTAAHDVTFHFDLALTSFFFFFFSKKTSLLLYHYRPFPV